LSVRALDQKALRRFSSHLDHCRCGRYCWAKGNAVVAGARRFIQYLQAIEEPSIRERQPVAAEPDLLKSFRTWTSVRRGTSDQGLYNYSIPICKLITHVDGPKSVGRLLLASVCSKAKSRRTLGRAALQDSSANVSAVPDCRRLLSLDSAGAIPVVPHWRLSSLPRYLPSEDVKRLIGSCDRSSAVGKRDGAVLLLLARLGPRAGDIVQMRLRGIDRKDARVRASGKSRLSNATTIDAGGGSSDRSVPANRSGSSANRCAIPPLSGSLPCPRTRRFSELHVASGSISSRDRGGATTPLHRENRDLRQDRRHGTQISDLSVH
jgi:hypothetical protein